MDASLGAFELGSLIGKIKREAKLAAWEVRKTTTRRRYVNQEYRNCKSIDLRKLIPGNSEVRKNYRECEIER
jgi:hypothetical protein